MKTTFPKNISSSPARVCRALTILEMLVSTAMLAFIVLGLTAMFIQVQKAFKTGIKQTTITDAGRVIIDMMASDLSQMSDPHFTNVCFPTNSSGPPPTLYWAEVPNLQFYQGITSNGVFVATRTNETEDIFATMQTNNTWVGVGYTVSNWFNSTSNNPFPGIGTLYRYVALANAPLYPTNQLFTNFFNQVGSNTFTNIFFHRLADGVVHLKIYAYDADGNEMYYESNYESSQQQQQQYPQYSLQYPVVVPNWTNSLLPPYTNYLPHSIDIELGILEPEALEHARALFTSGNTNAAGVYLANAVGQVEIFRQHIIIPAAP